MSDYSCTGCGAARPDDDTYYETIYNEATKTYDGMCDACIVRRWPCSVGFVFHYGVADEFRDRLQSVRVFKNLRSAFRHYQDAVVHVFNRRETETVVWKQKWDRDAKGRDDYSYRGWCSGHEIILICDETETPESLEWILYHELGHWVCNNTKFFDDAMQRENTNEARTRYEWQDDVGHEEDSEERLVNRIATAYMGGKEYARPWWRPRVFAWRDGVPRNELPDFPALHPHAPVHVQQRLLESA